MHQYSYSKKIKAAFLTLHFLVCIFKHSVSLFDYFGSMHKDKIGHML